MHWKRGQWDRVRAAYLSDFDHDPESPTTFEAWLERAVQRHVDRGPGERQQLLDDAVTDPERPEHGSGFSRAHPLPGRLLDQLEDAIAADRTEGGRAVSLIHI